MFPEADACSRREVAGRCRISRPYPSDVSPSPRLVALDIDGTLVATGTAVSPETAEAVRRAAERSYVVLATGRTAFGVAQIVDALGVPGILAVCSNGAVLRHPDGRTELRTTFDPKPVVHALDEALPGAVFAAERPGFGNVIWGHFDEAELSGPLHPASLDDLLSEKCPRLIAKWPHGTQRDVDAALTRVTLPETTATLDYGAQAWLTCVAAGTSKAAALEEVRSMLGVSTSDTTAIGDGTNDVEMLRWAARSVAMGEAPDIVASDADWVTGTVKQHGVARALDTWFG
jgi:hydroxymethylpyrimidine pyrophosphatase-like HAD family hydrolase